MSLGSSAYNVFKLQANNTKSRIDSRWTRRFSVRYCVHTGSGASQPPVQLVPGIFLEDKGVGVYN
jgi:hypothetical protein